jgi:hypothetical protein
MFCIASSMPAKGINEAVIMKIRSLSKEQLETLKTE